MKLCLEAVTSLRYKLRMFGVPIDEPTNVLCDNLSVVYNSSKTESTLNKKYNAIVYHAVRWVVATRVIRVGKVAGEYNLTDAMTEGPHAAFLYLTETVEKEGHHRSDVKICTHYGPRAVRSIGLSTDMIR